jgi:hypothetical protein
MRGLDQRLADDLDQVRGLVERDRSTRGDRIGELCPPSGVPSQLSSPRLPDAPPW